MNKSSGWMRLVASFMLLLCAASTSRLMAQEVTPTAVSSTPLTLGETVTGQLRNQGEQVSYSFEVPSDQDVVIAYESNHNILSGYCYFTTAGESTAGGCQNPGGGGDGPVSITFVIPAANIPDSRQTIDLTLTRPVDGLAQYSLTAYPVTPQPITLGENIPVSPDVSSPYQLYALTVDLLQPFTVQIEDDADDGAFLWAAHQPNIANPTSLSAEPLPFPLWIDSASREDNPDGITRLQLYHLGGQNFRVLVGAVGDYSLHTSALDMQPLAENRTFTAIVSYRQPLAVVRLDTTAGDVASVNVRVVDGIGALARVYTEGNPVDSGLALGLSSATGSQFPLSGTIERAVDIDSDLIVVLQVPYEFTRSQVTIEVEWRRAT